MSDGAPTPTPRPTDTRAIVLIGLRGSGKTTLGATLADAIGRPFIDLDQRTLTRLGASTVRDAWRAAGERAFRAAEASALDDCLREPADRRIVLSLGGGTPTAPGADTRLRRAARDGEALIIYLRCSPAELRRRLAGAIGPDRPSLTGADPLAEIDEVFRRRDALYKSLAHSVVEDQAQDDALARIRRVLRTAGFTEQS